VSALKTPDNATLPDRNAKLKSSKTFAEVEEK
jgi:hypothetical protein